MRYIKCVVWDLDNTIWNGIILEEDKITLKNNIIEILDTLDKRGILLSIASKNNYDDAIVKLNEFGIGHYFLYPQINWNAKSNSILEIQQSLNIGLETILFIDDQEYELEEVKYSIPEVTVINANHYEKILDMEILKPRIVTEDSSKRRLMYIQDQQRKEYEENFKGPSSQFMSSLNMIFTMSLAQEEDLLRAEELTIRTNQLNSTGIQYSHEELKSFIHSPKHQLWICELVDKYGSYGKIGLALIEVEENALKIKLLLMSCRIMSRGVGTVLLTMIMKQAKRMNKKLIAEFVRTPRNRQMLLTYQFANFKERNKCDDLIIFENDLNIIQDYPPFIKVHICE